MPDAVWIAVPIVAGGYLFYIAKVFDNVRDVSQGNWLLLRAALDGIPFTVGGILVEWIIETLWTNPSQAGYGWLNQFELIFGHENTVGFAIAVLLAIATAYLLNVIMDPIEAYRYILEMEGPLPMYRLFWESLVERQALVITLKNRRVYVGFLRELPRFNKDATVIFLRAYSGYRNPATLRVYLDADYVSIWGGDPEGAEQFMTTVPISTIEGIQKFDAPFYPKAPPGNSAGRSGAERAPG